MKKQLANNSQFSQLEWLLLPGLALEEQQEIRIYILFHCQSHYSEFIFKDEHSWNAGDTVAKTK